MLVVINILFWSVVCLFFAAVIFASVLAIVLDVIISAEFMGFLARKRSWYLPATLICVSLALGGVWSLEPSRFLIAWSLIFIVSVIPLLKISFCWRKSMPRNKLYSRGLKVLAIPCSLLLFYSSLNLIVGICKEFL